MGRVEKISARSAESWAQLQDILLALYTEWTEITEPTMIAEIARAGVPERINAHQKIQKLHHAIIKIYKVWMWKFPDKELPEFSERMMKDTDKLVSDAAKARSAEEQGELLHQGEQRVNRFNLDVTRPEGSVQAIIMDWCKDLAGLQKQYVFYYQKIKPSLDFDREIKDINQRVRELQKKKNASPERIQSLQEICTQLQTLQEELIAVSVGFETAAVLAKVKEIIDLRVVVDGELIKLGQQMPLPEALNAEVDIGVLEEQILKNAGQKIRISAEKISEWADLVYCANMGVERLKSAPESKSSAVLPFTWPVLSKPDKKEDLQNNPWLSYSSIWIHAIFVPSSPRRWKDSRRKAIEGRVEAVESLLRSSNEGSKKRAVSNLTKIRTELYGQLWFHSSDDIRKIDELYVMIERVNRALASQEPPPVKAAGLRRLLPEQRRQQLQDEYMYLVLVRNEENKARKKFEDVQSGGGHSKVVALQEWLDNRAKLQAAQIRYDRLVGPYKAQDGIFFTYLDPKKIEEMQERINGVKDSFSKSKILLKIHRETTLPQLRLELLAQWRITPSFSDVLIKNRCNRMKQLAQMIVEIDAMLKPEPPVKGSKEEVMKKQRHIDRGQQGLQYQAKLPYEVVIQHIQRWSEQVYLLAQEKQRYGMAPLVVTLPERATQNFFSPQPGDRGGVVPESPSPKEEKKAGDGMRVGG